MRRARIKADPRAEAAVYHCMSRTVNGERIFGPDDKDFLAAEIALVSEFCGVDVLTYALLENHFHILTRVPKAAEIEDREIVRRFELLHRKMSTAMTTRFSGVMDHYSRHGELPKDWREQQLRQMNDISPFMQLLKQRFSIGFNKAHRRYGTLWSERFKSLLVEPTSNAVKAVAMYIDLNAVRVGLVTDPKDYPHCGYGAAIAGSARSRYGIMQILGRRNWDEALAEYRIGLFSTGAKPKEKAGSISTDDLQRVLREEGKLTLGAALRGKVEEFASGLVIGGESYVRGKLRQYREETGARRCMGPHKLSDVIDSLDAMALRRPRARRKQDLP